MKVYETWWFWVLVGVGVTGVGTAGFLLALKYSESREKLPRRLKEVRSVSTVSRLEGD